MKYIGKPPKSRSGRAAPSSRSGDGRKTRPDRQGKERRETVAERRNPGHDQQPARPDRKSGREPREPRTASGPRPSLYGLHAVREAWLNPARRISILYLSDSAEAEFSPVLEQAQQRGLARPEPRMIERDALSRLLPRDAVHQGIALVADPLEEVFVQDIISIGAAKARAVILMLDQVTDPHNVGAILRSACAFGADGVIMQRRHAPDLEGVVAKTASGAVEHLAVAYETNLSRTLEALSEEGYTVIGLDEHANMTLAGIAVPDKTVLVLGAEGEGMRRLIREHCDLLASLPTRPPIASLNVSNAAAIALYALVK